MSFERALHSDPSPCVLGVPVKLFLPIVHLPDPVVAFCVKFRGKLNYCIKIKGFGIYKIMFLHPRCWLVPLLKVGACFVASSGFSSSVPCVLFAVYQPLTPGTG